MWLARDERFFKEGAKIIFTSRTEGKTFTYTEKNFYGTRNLFFIKSNRVNLKYISALLNSDLMYFYMKERLKHTGDLLQIDKNQFMKISLFVSENIDDFQNLVDQILEITSQEDYEPKNPSVEQEKLETEIDEMVIDLYELTEDQKELIRNFNTARGCLLS